MLPDLSLCLTFFVMRDQFSQRLGIWKTDLFGYISVLPIVCNGITVIIKDTDRDAEKHLCSTGNSGSYCFCISCLGKAWKALMQLYG